jgi:multidrug efflux pump subunit AcrB
MTSFSTILGIIPLVIADGAGAASRQAIGITIVSGFSIGTLFTLFVVPVMYCYFSSDKFETHKSTEAENANHLEKPA